MTISRLSDDTSGLAPFKSCFARIDASLTSSKRLETLPKQSSTVILAIPVTMGLGVAEHKGRFPADLQFAPAYPPRVSIIISDPMELVETAGRTNNSLIFSPPRPIRQNFSRSGVQITDLLSEIRDAT
jgi:hypothetical protein